MFLGLRRVLNVVEFGDGECDKTVQNLTGRWKVDNLLEGKVLVDLVNDLCWEFEKMTWYDGRIIIVMRHC